VAWGQPIIANTVPAGCLNPIEYGSDPASSTVPTAWFSALSSVPLQRHLFWRAWFIPNATQSPVLDSVTIPTSTINPLLDYWSTTRGGTGLVAPFRVDAGEAVYGTRSLRADVSGAGPFYCYSAPIQLRAGRSYVLTGLMKSQGNSGAQFQLQAPDGTVLTGGGVVAPTGPMQSPALAATQDWFNQNRNDTVRYRTPIYVAGADGPVYVVLKAGGVAGSTAWFDAIKLEESTVATPWSPGALGAVVMDAGGLQIDANRGGILRVKGSAGGARDTFESGVHGMIYGGDTEIASPATGIINVAGVPIPLTKRWRFVPVGNAAVVSQVTPATTALANVECTVIPANDPNIVAVMAYGMVRDYATGGGVAGGANVALTLANYDGTTASVTYTSGIGQRGGAGPAVPVMVGGVNNRQIKWASSAASNQGTSWVYVTGYWTVGE
jgi:hypothetical protein